MPTSMVCSGVVFTLTAVFSIGCAGEAQNAPEPDEGGRIAIEVAPLSLAGVTDASYTIRVTTAEDGGGVVVWERAALTSDQYGDGAGSLSFVGPCDASVATKNSVTVTLDALYEGDGVLMDAGTYDNPGALVRNVECLENQDVSVVFDITIARDAQQGFFDIAVDFDDIFCSAKLDCERDDGSDLELLHNPATGGRDMTAVIGFACTPGPGLDDTFLYMDDIEITCDGVGFAPVTIDPTGLGNIDTNGSGSSDVDGYLFGASIYRGTEQLAGKAYWNISLGIDETKLGAAGDCTLTARATASAEEWSQTTSGFPLPEGTVYPLIEWNVPLTDSADRVCTSHAVNAAGSGVETVYDGYLPLANGFTWSSGPVYLDVRYNATLGEVTRALLCEAGLLPDGAGGCVECSAATDCPDDGNDCTERTCVANACGQADLGAGASCGDPSDTACTDPDTCDGAGTCLANDEVVGASCGDAGTECTHQDTCDGSGACTDNGFVTAGTTCGEGATTCSGQDTCDGAGICQPNHLSTSTPCGDAGTECAYQDTCDGGGACADNGFVASGTGCGDPDDTACTDPDTCDGAGTCLDNHAASGVACGDGSDTACTDPDTCDGAGACLDNHEANGTSCSNGAWCDGPETCSAGVCVDGAAPCDPATETCDEVGDACDVDECAAGSDSCDLNATCTNTVGSYSCVCNPGYDGDGVTCTDIDECLTDNGGCDPLTTCTNTPGSRSCGPCPTGYANDGEIGCVPWSCVVCADADASAGGDGSCWGGAVPDLQTALSYAATALAGGCPAVEVWVAAGTYLPSSTGSRTAYFELESDTALYGGFVGGETSRAARDVDGNPTILSGDLEGDDVPPFGNNGDNSYHVVYASGVDASARLDGFVVEGGNAGGSGDAGRGGGAYFNGGAAPTIVGTTFRHNSAGTAGSSYTGGGGVHNRYASPTFTGVSFIRNRAGCGTSYMGGGAMYTYGDSQPVLTDVLFLENETTCTSGIYRGGGAIFSMGHSDPPVLELSITNARFVGNVLSTDGGDYAGGGAIFNNTASLELVNVTFEGNRVDGAGSGGAIFFMGSATQNVCSDELEACLEALPCAMGSPGYYDCIDNLPCQPDCTWQEERACECDFEDEAPCHDAYFDCTTPDIQLLSHRFTNVTAVGNSASHKAAAFNLWGAGSNPISLTNVVLAGNTGATSQLSTSSSSAVSVTWSCIEGWSGGGTGNIDSCAPDFVDADGADDVPGTLDDDVRLIPGSLGVDAGDDAAPGLAGITTDVGGAQRFYGQVDMGAYETVQCGALGRCPVGFACVDGGICQNLATNEVSVPFGTFYMGCNANESGTDPASNDCLANELEQHEVTLSAYAIDRTGVTVGDYAACVAEAACTYTAPAGDTGQSYLSGIDALPMNHVDWNQASDYCAWAGKSLCTEAQWERAARGGCETVADPAQCREQMRKYPWDDGDGVGFESPTCALAFYAPCDPDFDFLPEPAGARPAAASPYGALDMAGNVWEWTADWYADSYGADGVVDPTGPETGSNRVRRGGSMSDSATSIRTSRRWYQPANSKTYYVGFRCCRPVQAASAQVD